MSRCACGTGTCSCIVKAAPDGSVVVVGNGSPTRPYLLSVPGGNPLLNLTVQDDPTLDLTISGAGTAADKRIITGRATQSLTNLKDVSAVPPAEGEIPVWRTNHWEFEAAAAAGLPISGSWGTPPLDIYGLDSLVGQQVYLDANSQLRTRPDVIPSAATFPASALPSAYPIGTSVMTVGTADSATWPAAASCIVVTHRRADVAPAAQWCYLNNSTTSRAWYRNGNTSGWGPWSQVGGLFSGIGVATTVSFTPGAAQTDIPGMSVLVPVAGPESKFQVHVTLDLAVAVASASNFIASLSVPGGGTDVGRQLVFNSGSATAGPVGYRVALSQHWLITGLGASAGTIFKTTAAGTNWRINSSHSAVQVVQVA